MTDTAFSQYRRITPGLSVAPQIRLADLGPVFQAGFRAIILNRPDGEDADQPSAMETIDAAASHGLAARYIPVVPGQLTDENITAFGAALAELPGPILAYCRTGTRSAMLWALSQSDELSTEAILKAAAEAGYDLEGLRPRLDATG